MTLTADVRHQPMDLWTGYGTRGSRHLELQGKTQEEVRHGYLR